MPDPTGASPLAALSTALNALLPLVDPGRAEAVLRQAIVRLATTEDDRRLSVREPLPEPDHQAWGALKVRLRECGIPNVEIGRRLNLSKSTIDHVLSPNGQSLSLSLHPRTSMDRRNLPHDVLDRSI